MSHPISPPLPLFQRSKNTVFLSLAQYSTRFRICVEYFLDPGLAAAAAFFDRVIGWRLYPPRLLLSLSGGRLDNLLLYGLGGGAVPPAAAMKKGRREGEAPSQWVPCHRASAPPSKEGGGGKGIEIECRTELYTSSVRG